MTDKAESAEAKRDEVEDKTPAPEPKKKGAAPKKAKADPKDDPPAPAPAAEAQEDPVARASREAHERLHPPHLAGEVHSPSSERRAQEEFRRRHHGQGG